MEATRETLRQNKLDMLTFAHSALLVMLVCVCPPVGTEMDHRRFPMGMYLGDEALESVDAMISSWKGPQIPSQLLPKQEETIVVSWRSPTTWRDEGIALSVDVYQKVLEKIFVIKDGVTTPPATSAILPGITRDTLMTLARDRGYEVRDANIAREALYLADEVFMTGTAAEVVPVATIDKIAIGSGKRGQITKELQAAYFGLFNGTTEDKWGWLDYVYPDQA